MKKHYSGSALVAALLFVITVTWPAGTVTAFSENDYPGYSPPLPGESLVGQYSVYDIRDSGQLVPTNDPDIYLYAITDFDRSMDGRTEKVTRDADGEILSIIVDRTEYPIHHTKMFLDFRTTRPVKTMSLHYRSGAEYIGSLEITTNNAGYAGAVGTQSNPDPMLRIWEFAKGMNGPWLFLIENCIFPDNSATLADFDLLVDGKVVYTFNYNMSDIYEDCPTILHTKPPIPTFPAIPTNDNFVVDDLPIPPFDMIKIGGANYIKLRDAATIISGTAKQFSVDYNAASRRLFIANHQPYTSVGGELAPIGKTQVTATKSDWSLTVDDQPTTIDEVYSVGGNNYFPLRVLFEQILGCNVDYKGSTVYIATDTN
jgi:hypothetical protein